MKTFVIAGCRCGSHTLQKTLERNGFSSRRGHNPSHYKFLYPNQNFFDYIDEGEEITLIDVYRTPIERILSMFFRNILKNQNFLKDKNVEELNDIFLRDYKKCNGYQHFSDFITSKYGLQVPEFDFEKGYVKVTNGKITYVKILFSDIERWGDILSDVFGKKIRIFKDNITPHSKYKETKE